MSTVVDHDQPLTTTLRRTAAAAPALTHGLRTTLLLALVGSAGLVAAPLVLQRVLDDQLVGGVVVDRGAVVSLGVVGLAVAAAGALASRYAVLRMLVAAAHGIADLRLAALGRLHRLPLTELTSQRRGALVSRVTSDLDVVVDFVGWGGVGFVVGLARIVGALAALAVLRLDLAGVALVVIVAYGFVLVRAQRVVGRAHDRVRGLVAASLGAVAEAVSGLVTLRVFGAEHRARTRVAARLDAQFRAELRAGLLGAALFSSAEVFAALLTGAVLVAGVLLPGASVGDVVASLFLVALLVDPVQVIVETLDQAQSAASGLRRVVRLLDEGATEPADDATGGLPSGPLGYDVAGLSFAYPGGRQVLHEVTTRVPAGQAVAVVGETGSGKTTLARLLARLLPAPPGTVLLGGVELADVAPDVLCARVGFVPQEGFLWDASVRENVRAGRPAASDAEVGAVVARLGLSGWVDELPDGLDTQVGERGGRLSAGERQLVVLLRIALVDPDVLVLDEATSAVDAALEVRLRDAIARLSSGRTVVTVAHRLSTAAAADLVLVLHDGRLVQRGTHDELLAVAGGRYAALHADWTAGTAV